MAGWDSGVGDTAVLTLVLMVLGSAVCWPGLCTLTPLYGAGESAGVCGQPGPCCGLAHRGQTLQDEPWLAFVIIPSSKEGPYWLSLGTYHVYSDKSPTNWVSSSPGTIHSPGRARPMCGHGDTGAGVGTE